MATPNINAPEWAAAQETPWLTENQAKRIFDAFAVKAPIEDRNLTAPPGSCADGACYLIASPASGLWVGREGQMAIAFGANAASGWVYASVAREGNQLYVRDEAVLIEYISAAWVIASNGVSQLGDLSDVAIIAPVDGDILVYEASSGLWASQQPAAVSGYLAAANNLSDLANAATARTNLGIIRPVAFFFTTAPTASEVMLLYTACESILLADDFAGSAGNVGTNPTASFALNVQKNGASVGTITISTGGGFTFVTSGTTVSLAAGDQIKIVAPATPDATIANVSITLKGSL
jgi:hypothetical protein